MNITEQEAVEVINSYQFDCTMPGTFRMIKALSVVTSGMETLQRYRKTGTVERFRQLAEQFASHVTDKTSCPERHCNKCDKYRKENEKYHEIGTVEECQAARELQVAVEPRQVMLVDGRKGYECPNCGNELRINAFYGTYCHWCGKKLDWDRMGIKESL